ncbi:hypothetical protein ACFZB9_19380 [Kitasatospora sp. NPDC008050]|uniref:hypothetical protein n=1 Tax=Kitasatospora sp. NPDC008050 TaxID=3364021 RepID=UPI0036ED7B37
MVSIRNVFRSPALPACAALLAALVAPAAHADAAPVSLRVTHVYANPESGNGVVVLTLNCVQGQDYLVAGTVEDTVDLTALWEFERGGRCESSGPVTISPTTLTGPTPTVGTQVNVVADATVGPATDLTTQRLTVEALPPHTASVLLTGAHPDPAGFAFDFGYQCTDGDQAQVFVTAQDPAGQNWAGGLQEIACTGQWRADAVTLHGITGPPPGTRLDTYIHLVTSADIRAVDHRVLTVS